MKPSNSGASVCARAIGILSFVALLSGCSIEAKGVGDAGPAGPTGATGPAGPQGTPGVPCAGCVDSTSIAPGAVGQAQIAGGGVTAPALAVGAVTAPAIAAAAVGSAALAPGAVGTGALADASITNTKFATGAVDSNALAANSVTASAIATGSVTASKLVPGAVGAAALAAGAVISAKIAPGAVAGSNIAAATITGANVATGTLVGANIDPTTSLTVNSVTSSDFVFTTPVAGAYIALPTECHRGIGSGPALLDVGVVNYPQNTFGPSVAITNTSGGNYNFFCPIPVPVPPGATITVTGATMVFYDASANCLISAELRTKLFGGNDSGGGVSIATVYDGTSATDFAFTAVASVAPSTKSYPAFTPFTVTNSTVLYVNAAINFAAAGGGDCRYNGTRITYTLDRP